MPPKLLGLSLGWVPMAAGPVWLLLTGLMACAAWIALRHGGARGADDATLIMAFIFLCWLHPLYTAVAHRMGVRRIVEFAGSVVTLAVGVILTVHVTRASMYAAAFLLPVMLWLAVASYYLSEMLRSQGRTGN